MILTHLVPANVWCRKIRQDNADKIQNMAKVRDVITIILQGAAALSMEPSDLEGHGDALVARGGP